MKELINKKDITNFHVPAFASEKAEILKNKYCFSDSISVFKLSMSYAIKHHRHEIDFITLDEEYPSDGANYNVGSLDDTDGTIRKTICSLYTECTTPYRYARVLSVFGLLKLFEKLNPNHDNLFDIL